tara:strand:+ start:62 stop:259 length:198 start_codon:yes stop_codon:yes gene_type:complete
MANMSYCRFENTTRDMADCLHAIEYGETNDLSEYEVTALEEFLTLAHEITSMENEIEQIIKSYGN